jgi:tRNA threonylcarbamoyladenosine biosynthesis protein TsaE
MTQSPRQLHDRQSARTSPATALVVSSRAEADTVLLGRAIGHSLRIGDAVLISGELGAGKTRLVQGIAAAIGSPALARSPTFVIVTEHRGSINLSHADLYRVSSDAEAAELALDERLSTGAIAVEWAERAPRTLDIDALLIQFDVDPATEIRTISLTARGPESERLLRRVSSAWETMSPAEGAPRPAKPD